jgi:uncharacterized membrane protein
VEVAPPAAVLEEAGKPIFTMKVKHFLSSVDHNRIHQAIQSAEEGASGDIVLFISRRNVQDPLAAANHEFRKLRLETATHPNSLLIFLAPKSKKFAIVGGPALHDKMGQSWWDDLTALLTRLFKESRYTEGLVATIEQAGNALKTHFPANTADRKHQRDIVEE